VIFFHSLDVYKWYNLYTSFGGIPMRTNIVLEEALINQALRVSGLRTKRAAVEAGLRLLIQTYSQSGIRSWRGKVAWEGDLDNNRAGRVTEHRPPYKP
jgi:Arc/MetJ family transcription regulator